MEWRQFFGPKASVIVITLLLVAWAFCALPVMVMHHNICVEGIYDSPSHTWRTTVLECLKIGFHKEAAHVTSHKTVLHTIYDCKRIDLLWFFLIIPLLYLLSFPFKTQLDKTINAYRRGAKPEFLPSFLVLATILPGMLLALGGIALALFNYFLIPLILFIFWSRYNSLGISIAVVAVLTVIAFVITKLLKKWEIPHSWAYTIWILYLVMFLSGSILTII